MDDVKKIEKRPSQLTLAWAQKKGLSCWFEEETTSTNDIAKNSKYDIYLADHQTRGRGQRENIWSNSHLGDNFMGSFRFDLAFSPSHLTGPLVGLALFTTAVEVWKGLNWSLKAPNDLYIGKKKVAGLLIESSAQGNQFSIVIGLGLNVWSTPSDVEIATCLKDALDTQDLDFRPSDLQRFLDLFYQKLKNSLPIDPMAPKSQLINWKKNTEKLLSALNTNPLLKNPIDSVSVEGDFEILSKTYSWRQIPYF